MVTINMVNLKLLQPKTTNIYAIVKKRRFCRENLQIRALRKLWGNILRSPKASQLLPPCTPARRHLRVSQTIGCRSPYKTHTHISWSITSTCIVRVTILIFSQGSSFGSRRGRKLNWLVSLFLYQFSSKLLSFLMFIRPFQSSIRAVANPQLHD